VDLGTKQECSFPAEAVDPTSTCKACKGQHRPHTCGLKGLARTVPLSKGDPDMEIASRETEQIKPVAVDEEQREEKPSDSQASGEPMVTGKTVRESEDDAAALPDAPNQMLPPALLRLHKRLLKEVELYKLHVKHYHMSMAQFKRRTPELALPAAVYDLYAKVVGSCKECQAARPAPSRSRISGIRARSVGDVSFIDHVEVKFREQKSLVLLILDAATSFMWTGP